MQIRTKTNKVFKENIMEKQIKKLDEILNGKATEFFNECIEKEIREIKEKEFLFDDFEEFHNEEHFLIFQWKTEKELEKQGYKKDPEILRTYENFIDNEINHIFAEMEFEKYKKFLWKEVRNSDEFLKYKIKDRTVLVLKRAGRNGHKFAKEKYKEEYEFPY